MSTLPHIRSFTAAALLAPLALFLGACDDDATGPGATGTVRAEIYDGSGAGSAGPAPASQQAGPAAASTASGTLSGTAQASVWSEARGWVELGSATDASLSMQSEETAAVGSATVDADTYTRVRLVMEGFDADVQAGAVLGGLTLDAAVTITMGGSDGRVVIEKTVTPFTVSADADTRVRFDLNSETWVDQESAESRTAGDAEIVSATRTTVTSG